MEKKWIKSKLIYFISFCIVSIFSDDNTVDILASTPLDTIDNDDIIRVLTHDNESVINNFTSQFLIDELEDSLHDYWHPPISFEIEKSNPHYEKFADKIDVETRRLLEIVPEFDPGAGDVSPRCKKHSKIFQQELRKLTFWAMQMYDATGKIPSGLLNGNVNQFGDFDQCLAVDGSDGIRGKYCLALMQLDVDQSRPDLKHYNRLIHSHYLFRNNFTDVGHRIPRFGSIHWAVCVPESCTENDLEIALQNSINKYTQGTGVNITLRVDHELCHVQDSGPYPVATIIAGVFFAVIIALAIIAGICDHCNLNVSKLILVFSIKQNYLKIVSLKSSDDEISTVHGIRTVNAIMLMLGHKGIALCFLPFVNRTELSQTYGEFYAVMGRIAGIYTDPFIMMSGLLASYSMIKQYNKTGRIDVIKEYTNRLIRLVPTLAALLLFATHILPYLGSGPLWHLVVTNHAEKCKISWWKNLLFIHNYHGFEKMCLTHTHHIGIDTQLFAFAPVLVYVLCKWPKAGSIVLSLLAIVSTVLRFFISYYRGLNIYVYYGISTQSLLDTANFTYCLPTHRLTIYIIGIFLGYLLRVYPKNYKINTTAIKFGWIVSTSLCFFTFAMASFMGSINYISEPIHGAIYNAFSPIGCCLLFGWIILLSHTGNTKAMISKFFAWRGFLVFSRISYGFYLTQFPVFFYNVGRTRSSSHFEFGRMAFSVQEYFFIVLTAVALTIFIELPFQNLKNYFSRIKSNTKASNKVVKID